MQTYQSSDITRRSGEILEQAERGPVTITRYSKPRYVVMTAAHYNRLTGADPRTVHSLQSVDPDMREEMLALIDKELASE